VTDRFVAERDPSPPRCAGRRTHIPRPERAGWLSGIDLQ